MTQPIIDSEKCNQALALIKSIKEVPNPAYKKAMRDRKAFSPQPGNIHLSNQPSQPSLSEQEKPEYQRYEMDALLQVREICDWCPDCSDCTFAKTMSAIDRCVRVKRNMELKK
jgi:hypothetical protein